MTDEQILTLLRLIRALAVLPDPQDHIEPRLVKAFAEIALCAHHALREDEPEATNRPGER